jgi:uncharacterized protein (TIGR02588 family)
MRRNWLEWVILAFSVLAIAALVLYLGYETVSGDEPPDIRIEAVQGGGRATTAGWELPIVIRNEGGLPAASVTVEATATVEGAEETSELVLDLVAPGTEADMVVGFSGPPEGEVTFRLVGYEAP